ncbi:MAG: hypothetical protein ACFCAD_24100 [Pleurocapsa sp.]
MQIRRAVATNVNMPVFCLESLVLNKDTLIRLAIAKNPNAPADILAKLINDKDDDVRFAAISNSNNLLSRKVLKKLTKHINIIIVIAARIALGIDK